MPTFDARPVFCESVLWFGTANLSGSDTGLVQKFRLSFLADWGKGLGKQHNREAWTEAVGFATRGREDN
jgi:hypothetical protein